LIEAIASIGSELELETLLQRIVESATALVDARYGALGVLDESRTRLAQFVTTGIDDATRAAIGPLPDGHGILGLLIVEAKPLRLPDLTRHVDSGGFPPHHPPMTSFLGVPIRLRDEVFGNLYLTDKRSAAEFTALDEELAVGLAGAAAVAIEHARLYARVEDMTLSADRERIARDLHDTVIQRLFATGLALQATLRLVRADPEAAQARIERAVDELDITVRQIRTAIFGLGTSAPGGSGLRERVLAVATDAARPLGFHPAVTFEGVIDAAVDDATAREVLAAVREALTNIARHAHATRASIAVVVRDQRLTLEVADDGIGPAGAAVKAGRGLENLTARAANLHGSFDLAPGPSGGSIARWTVPLAPSAERAERSTPAGE
jgi:signal transduction histidine kinase